MKLITVILGLGVLFGQVAWGQATDEEQANHLMKKINTDMGTNPIVVHAGSADSSIMGQCDTDFLTCFRDAHTRIPFVSDPWDKGLEGGAWGDPPTLCRLIRYGDRDSKNYDKAKPGVVELIHKYKVTIHSSFCDADQDQEFLKDHTTQDTSGR